MTIQASSTSMMDFHQEGKEGKDDEDMTLLHTTIRCKDKVSLFLCILFSYFENKLLPKDIIIIRNHREDEEINEESMEVKRASIGRASQVGGPNQVDFESVSESRNSLR